MGNRTSGKQNSGGVTPPQQGRIVKRGHKSGEIAGGRAPMQSVAGWPAMSGIRAGMQPVDPNRAAGKHNPSTRDEGRVRSGADPDLGRSNTQGSKTFRPSAGAAPADGMTPPGAGKASSDLEQNRMDVGRRGFAKGGKIANGDEGDSKFGYAKGGKINRHGVEGKGSKDPKEPDADDKYAKGGKVRGADNINGGVDKNPKGTSAPANGGNGGLPGGNAPIPLAQPGGTPSTGVTASGRMQPSFAGADTGALTPDSGGVKPKLRANMVKRSGGVPSLPRPRRGAY